MRHSKVNGKKRGRPIIYYIAIVQIGKMQRAFYYRCRTESATRGDLKELIRRKTGTTEEIKIKMLMYTDSKEYKKAKESDRL